MNSESTPISRRALVTSLGAGLTATALAGVVRVEGQVTGNATAAPFADPTTKYPKPPYPGQSHPWPGLASKMNPRPDHGENQLQRIQAAAWAEGAHYRRGFRHGTRGGNRLRS